MRGTSPDANSRVQSLAMHSSEPIKNRLTKPLMSGISPQRRISAWLVHMFTASAAILGLYTLYAIYEGNYILALWLMGATIFIDSVDGTLARRVGVKTAAPRIDGALLDNIVDYLNYVITPAFFLIVSDLLPPHLKVLGASAIVFCSAYQFTQADAKTPDHFFKGFPSYWNIVVFYLFLGHISPWVNLAIITVLAILIFIPIKYLYLTRIDNITSSKILRLMLIAATLVYFSATVSLLAIYPTGNPWLVTISWLYGLLYMTISLYRTFVPMQVENNSDT